MEVYEWNLLAAAINAFWAGVNLWAFYYAIHRLRLAQGFYQDSLRTLDRSQRIARDTNPNPPPPASDS